VSGRWNWHPALLKPTWREAAIALIGTIGKNFACHSDSGLPSCANQFAAGQTIQDQTRVEIAHSARDSCGKFWILRRHVVEGTVGFDVMQSATAGPSKRCNRADLVEHEIVGFLRLNRHLASSEPRQVRQ